ncbi:hypothetical protein OESDEN_09260 [Oesophagostomum dentatum]|uniref:Uncharacterized protein n=1 Tax=Oesophagostomum dentatum TaxID=61180 RepID=A0A0B1T0W4_OESDE|nr:hypothetical protein OESDEN_09260 [Oesophagostomum dentatum]
MPMDIVGDERASSSQPPMSPGSTAQSASPNMGTPMSHFQPPYEPQTVPLPENNRPMPNSMEVSRVGALALSQSMNAEFEKENICCATCVLHA